MITCGTCTHFERSPPYKWGLCGYFLPWWCEEGGPKIFPGDANRNCECYEQVKREREL